MRELEEAKVKEEDEAEHGGPALEQGVMREGDEACEGPEGWRAPRRALEEA